MNLRESPYAGWRQRWCRSLFCSRSSEMQFDRRPTRQDDTHPLSWLVVELRSTFVTRRTTQYVSRPINVCPLNATAILSTQLNTHWITSISLSLTNPREALHHGQRVENKGGRSAQYDKLATELSWQRLRRSTLSSYSELFVESRQF